MQISHLVLAVCYSFSRRNGDFVEEFPRSEISDRSVRLERTHTLLKNKVVINDRKLTSCSLARIIWRIARVLHMAIDPRIAKGMDYPPYINYSIATDISNTPPRITSAIDGKCSGYNNFNDYLSEQSQYYYLSRISWGSLVDRITRTLLDSSDLIDGELLSIPISEINKAARNNGIHTAGLAVITGCTKRDQMFEELENPDTLLPPSHLCRILSRLIREMLQRIEECNLCLDRIDITAVTDKQPTRLVVHVLASMLSVIDNADPSSTFYSIFRRIVTVTTTAFHPESIRGFQEMYDNIRVLNEHGNPQVINSIIKNHWKC